MQIRSLFLRLRAALLRPRVEREMEAELAEHLESETEELIARGTPPAQARRRALATMGRLDAIKEECRDSRGTAGWEQLRQDVTFSIRLLLKNRVFSSMALATMALGIGSTTAVFSLIDGILLRPLAFAAPDRLFYVNDVEMAGVFDTLRANSRFAEYAAHRGARAFNTQGREFPERVKGSEVSANFFRVLGTPPLLGRTYVDGEDRAGSPRVAILSHEFWTQRYEARADSVGKLLLLDERSYEIIGVMPAGFRYPAAEVSFWVPMRLDPAAVGDYWGTGGLTVFARLRDGATSESATSELRAWIPQIGALFPWRMPDAWGGGARLVGLQEHLVAGTKLRSLLLLGVAGLVLLIAIVNVANLMIGQAAARQRELALRASLGATPGRLSRQLLTEAVVIALTGGALGMLFAFGQLELLKILLPGDTPRLAEAAIDVRMLGFTAALSVACGLLFGLLPALRARRQRSLTMAGDGRSTLSSMGARIDSALVVAEAAFATVLLVGAGLLLHSLWTMLQVNPGFQVQRIVTAELSPSRAIAGSLDKTVGMFEQVRGKLAAYPGVTNVAAMNVLPLTPENSFLTAAIEDHLRPPQEPQLALWSTFVTPEHLDTLGILLLQGRYFTEADTIGRERVVLISRAMARRFWPDWSPIGKRIRPVASNEWRTIVGVVEDVKNYSIKGPPDWIAGEIYFPLAQAYFTPRTISLAVRLNGDPAGFEKHLPGLIGEVCTSCAVSKIARMETVVAAAVQAPRSLAWLVAGFALIALGLAAAGIYGVVSHSVHRRTRELGVRLALGASRGSIAWLVMESSLRYTLLGTVAGLSASWPLAQWIKTLLYGISEHDPVGFSIGPVVLVTVAIFASLFPIWRAVRIDPAKTLREA